MRTGAVLGAWQSIVMRCHGCAGSVPVSVATASWLCENTNGLALGSSDGGVQSIPRMTLGWQKRRLVGPASAALKPNDAAVVPSGTRALTGWAPMGVSWIVLRVVR